MISYTLLHNFPPNIDKYTIDVYFSLPIVINRRVAMVVNYFRKKEVHKW